MTAHIYGPWLPGSTGTVDILDGLAIGADEVTTHIYKGSLYYTVIKA